MADIVDITDKLPHFSGEVKCLHCGHTWAGVLPITVDVWHIPCPQCQLERGVFACNAQPREGEKYWVCNTCDRDVYYVVSNCNGYELLCASCGERTPIGDIE